MSDTLIDFGSVSCGTVHTQTIYVMSDSPQSMAILSAEFEENVFGVIITNWEIPAEGSVQVDITFNSDQNLDYVDFLRIQVEGLTYPLIVRVEAQGDYSGSYYDATQNLSGETLKSALNEIIDGHTSLGYSIARDNMYGTIDNVDGYVECVYTGRTAQFNTRAGANDNSFNCEHTWPQSFFSENEPMRSDIFHLYPTDVDANSRRGNLDFGNVVSATWSEGGSQLGTDSYGQTVFEPRNVHKGNVARSYFYFIVRYEGLYNEFENPSKMEELFRAWHVSDPVDAAEQTRNESIYALQNNRNPFIDHPELIDRINNFTGTATTSSQPEIAVGCDSYDVTSVVINEEVDFVLAIINSGNASLSVGSITSGNSEFSVSESSANIGAKDYEYIHIHYTAPASETSDSTRISIISNDADESSIEVLVRVQVHEPSAITNSGGLPVTTELYQNYPNPFNPTTTIQYNVGMLHESPLQHVELSIYNTQGQKIVTLISEDQPSGKYTVTWNAEEMASGIYYYQLQAGLYKTARRMILIK
ncbi:MAG: endonuclease [Calditrichaceae bacterium]